MSDLTPSLRLAHIDGALDHCREYGNVPLATFESARNHLAAVVGEHCAALDELERLRMERAEFADLLGWHVDVEDDPCRLDHHGYCQAHGSLTEGPCRTAASRELLARVRAESAPQQPERGGAEADHA